MTVEQFWGMSPREFSGVALWHSKETEFRAALHGCVAPKAKQPISADKFLGI